MKSLITVLLLGLFVSSQAQNISQSQVRQFNAVPAYRVFGRGAGVGTPSFITLDSNHVPQLHSQSYYDSRYGSMFLSNVIRVNDSTFSFVKGDTLIPVVVHGGGSGSVTSVATNNGTGITGGTITATGTLAIDTLRISTRAWRQKGLDSLSAVKQNVLVSGTNLKTINGTSLLGSGDIAITGGGGGGEPVITPSNTVKQYWNGYKQFVGLNTDSVTEGTTNQFYTNARARAALSLTTTGTGAPSYNSSTGVTNIPLIPSVVYQTLTDAATVVWNVASGANATVTIAGNRTLSITNPVVGYGMVKVVQDASGSRTLTLPANSKVAGYAGSGTTINLSSTPAAIDMAKYFYDGTIFLWTLTRNFQ